MCLRPRLALALPVAMPVADVYYFYRPRDQPGNNNKGGRKSATITPCSGLGDMQHNKQCDMMTN